MRTTYVLTTTALYAPSMHAIIPEIYENKETVFNLRRQLSLSLAAGPGRKARQRNSSVKGFSREFHHFTGADNFEEYGEGNLISILL